MVERLSWLRFVSLFLSLPNFPSSLFSKEDWFMALMEDPWVLLWRVYGRWSCQDGVV